MQESHIVKILEKLAEEKSFKEIIKEIPGISVNDIKISINEAVKIVSNAKKKSQFSDDSLIIINTDGASRGNPGESAIGVVFSDTKGTILKELHKYIGNATNNIAEYTALIYALKEAVSENYSNIEIRSDSELLVRQMSGEYAVKNEEIKKLFTEAKMYLNKIASFKIKYISRKENKKADKLANIALDEKKCENKSDDLFSFSEKENQEEEKKKRKRINLSKVD